MKLIQFDYAKYKATAVVEMKMAELGLTQEFLDQLMKFDPSKVHIPKPNEKL